MEKKDKKKFRNCRFLPVYLISEGSEKERRKREGKIRRRPNCSTSISPMCFVAEKKSERKKKKNRGDLIPQRK